jgi:hypothetical protein
MHSLCPPPRARDFLRLPRRPRPPRNPWAWVVVAMLAAELVVLALKPEPEQRAALPDVDGAVLITTDMGERPVRRIIPAPGKGDPSWAKAPCDRAWQEEIAGTCWSEQARAKPPCPGGLYEHQGRCFAPITKGQRPPTSIGR